MMTCCTWPTSDVSGSCRWRDPSRRSPAWGRTCPPSFRTSTWTGCRLGSRPFASWLLLGTPMHFCETRTSPSRGPVHHTPAPDTLGRQSGGECSHSTVWLIYCHTSIQPWPSFAHVFKVDAIMFSSYWRRHPVFWPAESLLLALWCTLQCVCLLSTKTPHTVWANIIFFCFPSISTALI